MFSFIKTFKTKLQSQNVFLKSVGVLAGGTAIAQVIIILTLPVLTRLYSPDDFNSLAVYSSLLALLSVIACLRFEIAIPLPKLDRTAVTLLVLSLVGTLIITLLSALLIYLFNEQIDKLTKSNLRGYYWLIPIGVFFTGIFSAFQFWATRKKQFSTIAKTRVTQAVTSSAFQLIFGLLNVTPFGLLAGQIVKLSSGFFVLARNFFKENSKYFFQTNNKLLVETFKDYDRFPKYSIWEGFANTAALQIPVLLIAFYAVGPEAGFLMLAMQLLAAPMALIGQSTAQVYLSEAPEKHQQGNLKLFTQKIIISLLKISAIPMLVAALLSPYVVPLLLGEKWERVGVIISWMIPWFFMQFITSPVSMSLHITNSNRIAMLLQFFGLVFRVGLVWLAGQYYGDFVVEIYAVSGFVFYAVYMIVILSILKKTV